MGGVHSGRVDTRGRLPRRRWSPGDIPLQLRLDPTGVVLGTDRSRGAVTYPLLVPGHSTRVGVVGEIGLARLLALRLLSQSCDLTVVTNRPDTWQRLAAGVPETPFAIASQVQRWPFEGTAGPWALIIDMPEPPPIGFARAPWSTVVHLVRAVPPGSQWWQSANLLLTTRGYLGEVGALRPRTAVPRADELGDDDALAVDSAAATVFVPRVSDREYRLLTAIDSA